MKKKFLLLLIPPAMLLILYFYFKPEPVRFEMPVCTENGEVAYFKVSASWYRHWNGKRTLEGKMWIDDMEFHSISSRNWNWQDQSGRDVICTYISNRYEHSGMPKDTLRIDDFSEKFVYLMLHSQDKEDLGTILYLGPANTIEEYNLLYQEWLNTWFHD